MIRSTKKRQVSPVAHLYVVYITALSVFRLLEVRTSRMIDYVGYELTEALLRAITGCLIQGDSSEAQPVTSSERWRCTAAPSHRSSGLVSTGQPHNERPCNLYCVASCWSDELKQDGLASRVVRIK
jgi:hypothetical protein